MNDRVFFDTNILVYAIAEAGAKTAKAEHLLETGGYISVQVLNELASIAKRKLGMDWKEIDQVMSDIKLLCHPALPLKISTHEAGLKIAAKYGFTVYDSLILASALEARCSWIYTEDLQSGQLIEGKLMIQNPF